MDIGVYQIRNLVDGKIYIGSTIDSFCNRWMHHRGRLRSNGHCNAKLQNAWNKHGEDLFVFEVLETCDMELYIEREQYYIDHLTPVYNICLIAGNRSGYKHSEGTKIKIADAVRGFRHTDRSKEKMRMAKKGKKLTPAHIAKLTPQRRGTGNGRAVLTEEHVREIKQLLAEGLTQQQIANQFHVDQTLISRISRGLNWSHV